MLTQSKENSLINNNNIQSGSNIPMIEHKEEVKLEIQEREALDVFEEEGDDQEECNLDYEDLNENITEMDEQIKVD